MKSVKTINNQNAITDGILGLDSNSNTIINGNLILTDGTTSNTLNKSDWTGTIKTVNTTANLTHYLNFSDSASTGQNNPLKCNLITCNPSTGNISATSFNGSLVGNSSTASRIEITDNNDAITYYIPFCSGVGTSQQLLIDSITGPLSYNPSTSAITATSLTSNSINTTGTSLCNLWFQVATGSVNIMSGAQTTGSINIGSTTCTTGLLNVRCPLVLARQIQTTNSTTYPPNAVTHLGYTVQTLGASFTTTSLLANTNTNLFSYAFTSANYGTYLFSAIVALSPTDNTVSRQ